VEQRRPKQEHDNGVKEMQKGLCRIVITPFEPKNQSEAKRLILSGLQERWGRLDLSQNPDLDDIGVAYANATFLIGWMNGIAIATGALVPPPSWERLL